MVRLELLNRKDLVSLLNSERYKFMPHLPIGEMRGHSHVLNPNLDEDDILLILAIENDVMVGYLGILPVVKDFATNPTKKCGWFSCLWVDISQRGKGVSKTLLAKGYEVWNNQVLLAEYVPATKGMYQAHGVFEEYSTPGIRLYIRGDFGNILPPKHKLFMHNKTLLKRFDGILNTVFDLRFVLGSQLAKYKLEESNKINSELSDFIDSCKGDELFPRDTESLQWLIDNPWVRSGKKKKVMEEKYYFTSVSKRFEFKPIVVRNRNAEIVAYFIFALRDNHLRIPYLFSELDGKELVDIVYHFIKKWKVSTLTTYQVLLVDALIKKRFPVYHSKSVTRHFMIHKDLKSQIDWSANPVFQDGAGDSAFT